MFTAFSGLLCSEDCMYACSVVSDSFQPQGPLPGFSVHGIPQAKILEQVAISFSRGSSQPRDQTHVSFVSSIGKQIFYHCVTWEAITG